jgi:hypothetical protein
MGIAHAAGAARRKIVLIIRALMIVDWARAANPNCDHLFENVAALPMRFPDVCR